MAILLKLNSNASFRIALTSC